MKSKNLKYSIIAISIVIVVLILLYIFPNKSPFNNPDSFWKARENPVCGDILYLSKERNNFKNDTIFKGEIPVAVVIEIQNRFWAGDRIMTLKNIKTREIGTYAEK